MHLNIQLLRASRYERINTACQLGRMLFGCIHRAAAQHAVKVPKVNACGQGLGSLALDVFANIVLGSVQQARGLLAGGV